MSVELELGNSIKKQPIYYSISKHSKKNLNRVNQSLTYAYVSSTSIRYQYEFYHHQRNCYSFVMFEPTAVSELRLQQDSQPVSTHQNVTVKFAGTSSMYFINRSSQQQHQLRAITQKMSFAQTQIHLPRSHFIYLANNNLNSLEAISQWNCPNLEQVVACKITVTRW